MTDTDNPLLEPGLPAFDRIRPEHAEPAVSGPPHSSDRT